MLICVCLCLGLCICVNNKGWERDQGNTHMPIAQCGYCFSIDPRSSWIITPQSLTVHLGTVVIRSRRKSTEFGALSCPCRLVKLFWQTALQLKHVYTLAITFYYLVSGGSCLSRHKKLVWQFFTIGIIMFVYRIIGTCNFLSCVHNAFFSVLMVAEYMDFMYFAVSSYSTITNHYMKQFEQNNMSWHVIVRVSIGSFNQSGCGCWRITARRQPGEETPRVRVWARDYIRILIIFIVWISWTWCIFTSPCHINYNICKH